MKKFLENKSVGYYIAVAVAVISLLFGVIYMATYKNAIGNNAAGMVPESVGIFMIAGALVQIVLCVLPQYKFIAIGSLVLFGLSLYKEIFLIPDFIAGLANGVEYNGGNAKMNIIYLSVQFVIIICAIVACFMGFYKDEQAENKDFKAINGGLNLGKMCGGALLVVAAVLGSSLSVASLKKAATQGQVIVNNDVKTPKFNPITDDIKALADAAYPEDDPKDVVYAKRATYDWNDSAFKALSATSGKTREGHYLVYLFEGAYSEGYQGKYNEYYTNLYLWDDGLFTGKSNSQTFKGFWYNDADGDGEVDCLNMVSDTEKYASLVTSKTTGFYSAQAYVYMHPGWGDGRSIIVSGYMYYDCIALAIDTTSTGVDFKVGDKFSTSDWTVNRILANLNYSAVFDTPYGDSSTNTQWTIPSDLIVDGKLTKTGEFEIKATWGGFTATVTITVAEA